MLGVCVLIILLWLLLLAFWLPDSMGSQSSTADFPITSNDLARGYPYGYNHVGAIPFLPFLEPLVILAGIAFIAFLIQTFHAIYVTLHPVYTPSAHTGHTPSLLGGVIESVVPTRHRTLEAQDDRIEEILAAIRLYKIMNKKRKNRPSTANATLKGANDAFLIPVITKPPPRQYRSNKIKPI